MNKQSNWGNLPPFNLLPKKPLMSFWFCTIVGLFFAVVIFFNLFTWNIISCELEVIFYIQLLFFYFFYCLFSFHDNLLSIIFIFWPLSNRNIHYTFTYNTPDKIFKKRQLTNKFKDKYLSIKHRDGIILAYFFLGLWVWRAKTVHFMHFKGYQN